MSAITFEPWPKIPRLNRGILVTEKIDGTNAAVVIFRTGDLADEHGVTTFTAADNANILAVVPDGPDESFVVLAQSRTRFITPEADNYGFAAYVKANAEALVSTLGPGRHFGEWWGAGIQRRYGLSGKRFSLFNVDRWADVDLSAVPGLGTVPVLYRGPWNPREIDLAVLVLELVGSSAAPGFDRPEGVVVWHYASRTSYKVTVENDGAPKGEAAHAADEEKAA
ncbi:RNA ligase family protein [Herbiconiux moechotypicola]|uniref:RNA ligase domain-containing protein n=1 Tax=Herbiconiux moechotypicola TaxID=637393 RepID=A0ABN3DGS5_9MICO|nr:RNA ligase family protein [Herbiconiux moechotypicola]MCS5729510.1 RNA ligase family protein [Herbiconiux moechotypicola]